MSERFFSISRPGFLLPVVLLGAVAAAAPSAASKLDKDSCAGLADEFTTRTADGLKAEMERGPAWAVANMSPDRLRSARRLLELEDQLEFRCGGRGLPPKKKPAAPVPNPAAPAMDARAVSQAPKPGAVAPAANAAPASAARTEKTEVTSPSPSAAPAAAPPRPAPPAAVPAAKNANEAPAPGKGAGASAGAAPKIPPGGATTNVIPRASSVPQTGALSPAPQKPAPQAAAPVVSVKPAPVAVVPAVAHPAPQKPAVGAVAAADPQQPIAAREAPPATGGPPVTKLGALPSAATAAPVPASTGAAAAARKKNPRRTPSSAYVSPSEVSPFSLQGLR